MDILRYARTFGGKILLRILLIVVALTLYMPAATTAQTDEQPSSTTMAEFFSAMEGDWVGVCRQTTDGKPLEDKYFQATVQKQPNGSIEASFVYYNVNPKGVMTRIGGSNIRTTIAADGLTAVSTITGSGELLLDKKPKRQEHLLTETVTCIQPGCLQAKGDGTLKVYGTPLGIGQSGKVREDISRWTLTNDTLSITHNLNIVFRALCFSKTVRIDAEYTAIRGKELSSKIARLSKLISNGASTQ
ncbi:MAG: hypothetical protein ACOX3G_02820 [Armatimonadota bacterium]|jgi:hypothetical protein